MTKAKYSPDWIPPPGATIEDLLASSARSRQALIEQLGTATSEKLFTGRFGINSEMATYLAREVGLSKSFWLEREKLYREALERRKFEKKLLSDLPLREMKSRSFIKAVRSHAEDVDEVVRFFGEDSPESCRTHIDLLPVAIKQKASRAIVSRPGSLAVWIRAGEIEAEQVQCKHWNRQRLKETVQKFRQLTRKKNPASFLPELKRLCQNCGVALVIVRPPNGCTARGAVKRLSPEKMMLLLSFRHLSDDQFWFSFFHEIAHLLLHPLENIIIDDWEDSITNEELEADQYAAEILIPREFHADLAMLRDDRSIIRFARQLGISRGIVVGQMQFKKIVGFNRFTHLKVFYQWNSHDEVERKN